MSSSLIPTLTFLATAASLVAAWTLFEELFLRDRSRINQRLNEKFRPNAGESSPKSSLFRDLKMLHEETTQTEPSAWKRYQTLVEQSGVDVTPVRLLQLALALGAGAAAGGVLALPWWPLAIPLALCAAIVPLQYVSMRRKGRVLTLCQQLPDAFELMSRAVRAGQTMTGSMQMVASQGKAPLSEEFAYCCEQENLGLPPTVALQDLARRTGVIELQFFVVAMLVQRQAGGNPVEILGNLSHIIRKRMRLMARVKALTGEGRMQALVLSLLPAVALVALFVLNRSYADALLTRPWLLFGVLASEVIGTLWIRRIVNFDF
jgi:tight adherence protein B